MPSKDRRQARSPRPATRARRRAWRLATNPTSSTCWLQLSAWLHLAQISRPARNSRGAVVPPVSYGPHLKARIGRDQGTFAAGTPPKESYNKALTPATNAPPPRLNTDQI